MNHLTVGMRLRKMNLPFYLLCSGYIPSVNTLREEIFAGINFANFFSDILRELIFANLALLKISRELIFAN